MIRSRSVCRRGIRLWATIAAYLPFSPLHPQEALGDEPEVACCRPRGGCDVAAYSACVQEAGDPQPPGVSCASVAC